MNLSLPAFKWVTEHTKGGIGSPARTVDLAARQARIRSLTPRKPEGSYRPLNVMVASSLFTIFGTAELIRDHVEAAAAEMPVLQSELRLTKADDLFDTQADPRDDEELCARAITSRSTAEFVRRRHYAVVSDRVTRFLSDFGERASIVRVWRPSATRHEIRRRCRELELDADTVEEVFSKLILQETRG